MCLLAYTLSHFSCVPLFATLWTIACQAPPSMGFSRQYWNGLPCPPPGDLPDPGMEPMSLVYPALAGRLFTSGATWEAPRVLQDRLNQEQRPVVPGQILRTRQRFLLVWTSCCWAGPSGGRAEALLNFGLFKFSSQFPLTLSLQVCAF